MRILISINNRLAIIKRWTKKKSLKGWEFRYPVNVQEVKQALYMKNLGVQLENFVLMI